MQKTPEDEAFDELERRRGGFRAKRAMAAAKSEWLTGCPTCGMDAKCDCDTAASVLGDQVKYGASWSKDGERIDPMSVYKEQPAQGPVAWCPDVCPITGLPFFMWIEHHETGQMMPTYGGPYDSYTIPVRDKDGSYCRERYDHDNGWWVTDEVEDVGVQIVSDQAYVSEDEPPQRKPLTEEFIMDSTRELSTNVRWPSTFIDVWRLCEAAHGIKEKNT